MTVTTRRRLLLVEPNPVRSRLQILGYAAEASLVAPFNQVLVLPSSWRTAHSDELLPSSALDIREVARNVTDDVRRLSGSELLAYIRETRRASRPGDVILLMALDELWPALVGMSPLIRLLLPGRRVGGLRYRPHHPTVGGKWVRSFCESLVLRFAGVRLIVFDERLAGVPGVARVLPDPWSGDFTTPHPRRDVHRAAPSDGIQILCIGRQDHRKGLDTVMRAAPLIAERLPEATIVVQGGIDRALARDFAEIQHRLPGLIRHNQGFIAESELPAAFQAADVILLPYAETFRATSGVLARAAAAGVPVVASEHGLVGHRVSRWRLGGTFKSGDAAGLVEALQSTLAAPPEADNMRRFAASCTASAFKASFLAAVEDMVER